MSNIFVCVVSSLCDYVKTRQQQQQQKHKTENIEANIKPNRKLRGGKKERKKESKYVYIYNTVHLFTTAVVEYVIEIVSRILHS